MSDYCGGSDSMVNGAGAVGWGGPMISGVEYDPWADEVAESAALEGYALPETYSDSTCVLYGNSYIQYVPNLYIQSVVNGGDGSYWTRDDLGDLGLNNGTDAGTAAFVTAANGAYATGQQSAAAIATMETVTVTASRDSSSTVQDINAAINQTLTAVESFFRNLASPPPTNFPSYTGSGLQPMDPSANTFVDALGRQYDRSNSLFHEYTVLTLVGDINKGDNVYTAYDMFLHTSGPGQPNAVVNNSVAWLTGVVSPNPVLQEVSADGLTVRNTTIGPGFLGPVDDIVSASQGHFLDPGVVTRTIWEDSQGKIWVQTVGVGYYDGTGGAAFNDVLGKIVFGSLDLQIANAVHPAGP